MFKAAQKETTIFTPLITDVFDFFEDGGSVQKKFAVQSLCA